MRTLSCLVLVLAFPAVLSACGGDPAMSPYQPGSADTPSTDPTMIGSVTLELTTVPAGVQCLSITVTPDGGAPVTKTIAVTAGSSSTSVALGQLPLGNVTFDAAAYNVACASIGTATPTWVADQIAGELEPGVVATVPLDFRKNNPVTAKVSFIGNIVGISAADSSTFEIESDGSATWWGAVTSTITASAPQPLSIVTQAAQIVTGGLHACYLKTTGTVFCWGLNSNSQIPGAAANATVTTPIQVPGITDATSLAAGSLHTCAVTGAGNVLCWGDNGFGQLGNGTTTTSSTPVTVSSVNGTAATVTAGTNHTCARLKADGVQCWGANASGQLGDGTTTFRPTPITVAVPAVKALSAGGDHTCAVIVDGTARCWGNNTAGQAGDGTTTSPRSTPVVVSGLVGAQRIAAGGAHTCATAPGGLRCWGDNSNGALGLGSAAANFSTPQPVPGLSAATLVTAGTNHTCAFLPNPDILCWGRNTFGQLGDGTNVSSFVPVFVGL